MYRVRIEYARHDVLGSLGGGKPCALALHFSLSHSCCLDRLLASLLLLPLLEYSALPWNASCGLLALEP